MNNFKHWLLIISRILIGIVFIYSGFVKSVDPLGSTYKFIDYFNAFGTTWANSVSFILSVIQSLAEFVIGASLVLNLRIKLSSLGALIFMLIFTPLTLYIAIASPVHDCGCFGDALVITNWQTFWKNLIILVPTLFLFKNRHLPTNLLKATEQWIVVAVLTIFIGIIIQFSYNHLPLIDFRPYKIGTSIPEGMEVPEGAPVDEYKSVFIYSKDGVEKEFEVSNLPDSTWTFVDARHDLIKKGYEPLIHDFTIVSTDGTEITDIVLSNQNYYFLLVAYDLKKASNKNIDKINKLAAYSIEMGYSFIGLTSSGNETVDEFISETEAIYEFYNTDETTLKTIIRSNPGLVLVKDGIIINKWHHNDIPDPSSLKHNLVQQSIAKYESKVNTHFIYIIVLLTAFFTSLYLLKRKQILKIKPSKRST